MNQCRICSSPELPLLLDCGPQPICNRYLRSRDEAEALFPLALHQCRACGTIQLANPVPAAELKPSFDWITYTEPEAHLDELAEIMSRLPGLTSNSVIAGVSFKDDSTIARMERKGFTRVWRVDGIADLGSDQIAVGVETIQDRLTPQSSATIAATRGRADVLIARHIYEHAHQPLAFLRALTDLLRPGGYLVVEAPDCARALEGFDYTTIWEEHAFYFTAGTFLASFSHAGLEVIDSRCYPYPFENSLVAILQRAGCAPSHAGSPVDLGAERARAEAFAAQFDVRRDRLHRFLAETKRSKGPIAMFGAGHLACTFIYLLGLGDLIDFVIDDSPHKQGLFMPGSRLPIVGSAALRERGVALCLLSLNPTAEEKVMRKHQAFVDAGGKFASIAPASPHALRLNS
jgi:SAM-dependent methyltransferase